MSAYLQRRTALKAKRRISQISPKRLEALNAEVDTCIALCKRCGGKPIISSHTVYCRGIRQVLHQVICLGGTCEVCGEPAGGVILDKHHKITRSRGGLTTLDNCVMAHRECHMTEHGEKVIRNSKLQWSNAVCHTSPT